jgi:hypothetical protein
MEISTMQCAHDPFYDIDPQTGARHRSVLRRSDVRNFWQVWFGMVLVLSPTWLLAGRSSDWSVCYELRSLSERHGGGADLKMMRVIAPFGPALRSRC